MIWYGVIRRIISLEFPTQKEVLLFQCDWYDVPAARTSRNRGYSRDKYGSNEDLSNWTRADKQGTTGDASVTNQVRGEADDDEEDDTYIDDGVVAPVVVESLEDDFFI
ncbi:hypothetical protein PVAP13_4KG182210 [Panicum virgatum]|uniref:DUF4216 domain-containing protein n=1 Tax=Panicum virgatum TaxID=38727 RepID=A0A8T0TS41_PANVG|nr:hypothetical protein PVAP13_4KG182210 [Panicum virgatum]